MPLMKTITEIDTNWPFYVRIQLIFKKTTVIQETILQYDLIFILQMRITVYLITFQLFMDLTYQK